MNMEHGLEAWTGSIGMQNGFAKYTLRLGQAVWSCSIFFL
jgi:hypothetical protein